MIIEHGTLEDGRRYAVLEELTTVCPLGIRFWDAVSDDQIRDGLHVRAWPLPARRPVIEAFRSVSGVYAFQGLPGLVDVEQPSTLIPASPPTTRPFIIEVRDPERRFLPVAFTVDLPVRGLYLSALPGSPGIAPPGFYLFSSPVRQRPPGVAVVRGELFEAGTSRPASWALVRVTIEGQGDRWGLADTRGRFAVQFALPLLTPGFGALFASPGGPASPPGPPVGDRTWDVSIAVFWEPARLAPLAGTPLPDFAEVLQQAPAGAVPVAGSPVVSGAELNGTLPWHGELFAATDGAPRRELWVVPTSSP